MKKLLIILLSLLVSLGAVNQEAFARVDTVTVLNTNNKSAKTITTYVKNSDNKIGKTVKLELQKNGKTVSVQYVSVKKNTQVKKVFNNLSKGKYRIKYTVNGKYSYTPTYNH